MASKAQIRQRVGENLGIVPINQALEAQDQTRIDDTFNEAYQLLKDKGIAGWALNGDVPDRVVPYLVLLMCWMLLESYSVPDVRYTRIVGKAGQDGGLAIAKIASVIVQEYDSNDVDHGY